MKILHWYCPHQCDAPNTWDLPVESSFSPIRPPPQASVQIKHLFLDNTYCNPSLRFPPRAEAAARLLRVLKELLPELSDHAAKVDACSGTLPKTRHRVVIGMDTLGKEDLLQCVATELGVKLLVSPDRMHRWKLLGLDTSALTTEEDDWIGGRSLSTL